MSDLAKLLIVAGTLLVIFGLVLTLADKVPWIGKLPGDIAVKREKFSFYFPWVTCLILSLILTALLNIFGRK